jgi:hypothetical protein
MITARDLLAGVKRQILFVMLVTLLGAAALPSPGLATTMCDLNGDGQVTAGDALLALKMAVGLNTVTVAASTCCNSFGYTQVNAACALLVLREAVGLSSPVNVSGKWVGTYTSKVHGPGPGTISITQNGTSISGTVTATFDDPTYGDLNITGTIAGTSNGATITATQVILGTTVTVGGRNYQCNGTFSGSATVNTQANPLTGLFDLTGSWSPSYCGGSDTITGTGTLQ